MSRSHASAASPFLIGAALAAVAFGASGGTDLGRTTVVEVLLLLAGAGLVAAAIMFGPEGRLFGGASLLGLAALALLTGLSILWSVAPELSFVEAGRTLAYLAALAGAVAAARLWPTGSPQLAKGILLAGAAIVGYALASRVWPGALAEDELSNRLGQPYSYWNAVAITGGMMVPAALWLGSRRTGSEVMNALAYPALGAAVLAILLTQSRGTLAAAAIGAVIWFAAVPLRLRSLPVLAVPLVGVAPVAAWALSKDAFSKSEQSLAAKEEVATEFGLLVVLALALLFAAGVAAARIRSRWSPSLELRRRIGIGAVAVACAVPLVVLAASVGSIGDKFDDLTSETAAQPEQGAERFAASSSTRGSYWREAGRVFGDRVAAGTGAGTFAVARLRYRKRDLVSRHAHGFIPQTIADLGLAGLFVVLGLAAAWLVAAAVATGAALRLRSGSDPPPRRDWTPERTAVVGLALVALVFGIQSALDWTWFVPGTAVMALAAAGFVAGRGPVASLTGQDGTAALPRPAPTGFREIRGVKVPVPRRSRLVAAGAVLLCALLCVWAVWQPERADRLTDDAVELIDQGQPVDAVEKARDAGDANPLAARPMLVEAAAKEAAGDERAALHTLEETVLNYPGETQPWLRLASFQFAKLDKPADTLETLKGLLFLDPKSKPGRELFLDAKVRLRIQEQALNAPGR